MAHSPANLARRSASHASWEQALRWHRPSVWFLHYRLFFSFCMVLYHANYLTFVNTIMGRHFTFNYFVETSKYFTNHYCDEFIVTRLSCNVFCAHTTIFPIPIEPSWTSILKSGPAPLRRNWFTDSHKFEKLGRALNVLENCFKLLLRYLEGGLKGR